MSTRVIVNGAFGKMGKLACETIENHADFNLVATLGRDDDLAKTMIETQAEIVIDLTRADCVYENSLTIINHGAHPVIGTSGLLDEDIKTLKARCDEKNLGGIIVPNFSISVVMMMHFASVAARYFPEVEIIEAHHQQKLDAPSGTAMKTAEMIATARRQNKQPLALKELIEGARGASCHNVPVHSLRLPGVLARQDIIFGNAGETLTLSHNTLDRSSFMPGLILACQQVTTLKTLYYGLHHLLDFS